MSPPSSVDDLMPEGWVSGGTEAPEPVAVPDGTPEAPRPTPVAPVSPVGAAEAPAKKDDARQSLRLNIPLGDNLAGSGAGDPARIQSAGLPLAPGLGSDSPALSIPSSSLPEGTPSRLALETGLSPSTPDPSRASAGLATPEAGARGPGAPGLSPRLGADTVTPTLPGSSASPGLAVARADTAPSGSSSSLRLELSLAAPLPVASSATALPQGASAPSAPASAATEPGRAPSLGQLPLAADVSGGASAPARIGVSASGPRTDASAATPEPGVQVVLGLTPGAALPTQSKDTAPSVEPGQRGLAPSAAPGAPPGIAVPSATTTPSRGPDSAITPGAFGPTENDHAAGASRLEAERKAREEERLSHGSALRRWLQDHFPFLF